MRIAVGGFQHETNTFAGAKATYEDFLNGGGGPPLQRGSQLIPNTTDMNLPISGIVAELLRLGHKPVPLVWAAATPSAHVTQDAYERIVGMMIEELRAIGRVDGVCLDLHGAMVAEHLDDGEGEVLRRVREVVGPSIPVVAALDLHANVTPEMVARADLLVAYRTYPHVDMAETGRRAAHALHNLLTGKGLRYKAFRQAGFLIPLSWQCTLAEPAKSIYDTLAATEAEGDLSLSFTPGFPATDIPDCGPAVLAYAASQAEADRAADRLLHRLEAAEPEFAGRLYSAEEGVAEAITRSAQAARPVILADTQDNPGAGGSSDTVGLLKALVAAGAKGAVFATVTDPESAAAAQRAGEGATVELALGGKSGGQGQSPYRASFLVERLGDGIFTGTGPMYQGVPFNLGPMALLRLGDVRVVVSSRKQQAADQSILRHLGVEPAAAKILALKSSVHFRADFQPIAEAILVVTSPGFMSADPADLPFTRLRDGLRLNPKGPPFRRA